LQAPEFEPGSNASFCRNDLEEIPENIRHKLTFHPVKKTEEVLRIALEEQVSPLCNRQAAEKRPSQASSLIV
jgi:ATP-dependent Lon protease